MVSPRALHGADYRVLEFKAARRSSPRSASWLRGPDVGIGRAGAWRERRPCGRNGPARSRAGWTAVDGRVRASV